MKPLIAGLEDADLLRGVELTTNATSLSERQANDRFRRTAADRTFGEGPWLRKRIGNRGAPQPKTTGFGAVAKRAASGRLASARSFEPRP